MSRTYLDDRRIVPRHLAAVEAQQALGHLRQIQAVWGTWLTDKEETLLRSAIHNVEEMIHGLKKRRTSP